MEAIERDYRTVLLASHAPPCLSLYQPTHRAHPNKEQDPIRFRNLVKELELLLGRAYPGRESAPILRPFHDLAEDRDFWNHSLDGVAVFATADLFKVYRLQRPVRELVVVTDSFHTKPLIRILQSADRYHVLGLDRHEARLFEGNRYALDEVELSSGLPWRAADIVGVREGERDRKSRMYGSAGQGGPRSMERMYVKTRSTARRNVFSAQWTRLYSSNTHGLPACPFSWRRCRSITTCFAR